MNGQRCVDRMAAAILRFQHEVAIEDWLSLIVLSAADAAAWRAEGDPQPQRTTAAAWSGWPGEFMGVVVFEEGLADRSYLLDRDGQEYFF